MRTINFRGKSLKTNEWVFGFFSQVIGRSFILIHNESAILFIEVEPESVGQYIGREDCNGVEIYEGDLIEISENCNGTIKPWINEVVFRHNAFCLVNKECCELCKEGFGITCYLCEAPGTIKVIGNTTDNPELTNKN